MTTSEAARHVRAELETISASLPLHELTRLLELGRRLLARHDEIPSGDTRVEETRIVFGFACGPNT